MLTFFLDGYASMGKVDKSERVFLLHEESQTIYRYCVDSAGWLLVCSVLTVLHKLMINAAVFCSTTTLSGVMCL